MGRSKRTGKRSRRMARQSHGTRRPVLMAGWFHGPAERAVDERPPERPRVATTACFICNATTGITLGADRVTWLCEDVDACAALAQRETEGGADAMHGPLAGASRGGYEWEWRDQCLVYSAKEPRLRCAPDTRQSELVGELQEDMRAAASAHRRRGWQGLAVAIQEEFAEYSQREHEVIEALEWQRAYCNDVKRQWAADNPHRHRAAVYRWRAKNPAKACAIAKRYNSRKARAIRVAGGWSCKCRNCGVEFCPVRTRAKKHCSDACRRAFGHQSEYARLGTMLGLPAEAARRVTRTEQRRAKGIGPRKRTSIGAGALIGYYLVLDEVRLGANKGQVGYRCRCRCGFERVIAAPLLAGGKVLSCRSCRHKREREATAA